MSFIKKRFDYNDLSQFLPDNQTIGTADYYRKRFNDKLPDSSYLLLEAKARREYTEEETKEIIEDVYKLKQEYNERLMKEYEDKCNEGKEELEKQLEEEQKQKEQELKEQEEQEDLDLKLNLINKLLRTSLN